MNSMKIIMNPPYDKNLHLKILDKMTKDFPDAEVVSLQPTAWLENPASAYRNNSVWKSFEDLRKKINIIEIINGSEASNLFNVPFWNNLGIYIRGDGIKECLKKLPEHILQVCIDTTNNNYTKSIAAHFNSEKTKWWIKCPRVHGHIGMKDELDLVAPDIKWSLNIDDKENKIVYFKTKDEAVNFFNSLKTKFYKYLKKCGFYSKANVFTGLPWLDDYTHPWTDKTLYEYFKLTPEEIATVEKETGE